MGSAASAQSSPPRAKADRKPAKRKSRTPAPPELPVAAPAPPPVPAAEFPVAGKTPRNQMRRVHFADDAGDRNDAGLATVDAEESDRLRMQVKDQTGTRDWFGDWEHV
mmetsp:Transcript_22069/g.41590  ORF Transcript_22069/g.41590 Transcript_22069/m.41590 type:complete len:108 (-) Transcript_22069:447-770(-)